MRRADRLIQITHFLRQRRRAVTAQQIADTFRICTRTVYRDIQSLIDSGVPIMGEAGVGYLIDKQYYLPPITFDQDELEAIGLGISMVCQWTDDHFAHKAKSAFAKIQAVLPAELQSEWQQIVTHAPRTAIPIPWSVDFSEIRESIRHRCKLQLAYADEVKQQTQRVVRPLGLFFFSPVWLLASWCELRQDFRNFRIDRIRQLQVLDTQFDEDDRKGLAAYLEKEARSECFRINNLNPLATETTDNSHASDIEKN